MREGAGWWTWSPHRAGPRSHSERSGPPLQEAVTGGRGAVVYGGERTLRLSSPGFESQLSLLPAVCPWSDLTHVSLSLPLCSIIRPQ